MPANYFQRDAVTNDLDWLAESYPAMRDLVDLYRGIDHLQAEIAHVQVHDSSSRRSPPCGIDEAGRPLLEFQQVPLEAERLAGWVHDMCELMERYGVQATDGEGQGEMEERLSVTELLEVAREGLRQRAGPTQGGFAGSLPRLALGQVVAAILRGVASSRLPALDAMHWQRGYCPICGGWPDLGALDSGTNTQTLVCSRCDTMWAYRRVGCPYCSTDADIRFYASSDESTRLSVCGGCGAYLKQVRLPLSIPVRSLLGLRLLTVGQDLDAQEAGWSRPLT